MDSTPPRSYAHDWKQVAIVRGIQGAGTEQVVDRLVACAGVRSRLGIQRGTGARQRRCANLPGGVFQVSQNSTEHFRQLAVDDRSDHAAEIHLLEEKRDATTQPVGWGDSLEGAAGIQKRALT